MNWFDIFSILFLCVVVYVGSKRGLILELFDMIVLILGLGLTFNLYSYLARFILSFLPWNKTFCAWFSFFVIFIIIAGILIFVSLLLDKTLKLAVVLKQLNAYGGLIIALIKSIFMLVIILVLILTMPIKKEDKKMIFNSSAGKIVWSFYGPVKGVYDIVNPTFVSDYIDKAIKDSGVLKKS